ncbi:PEPxxWA-CTERM sorting domain-containing protein [Phenylobacterium sp.]|uniref:PEPxxWA-CTERM sorting domain-containing protein n=1 Tax=Phenylobacterium sp. TaxID=1871053 RepID=UPI003BAD3924
MRRDLACLLSALTLSLTPALAHGAVVLGFERINAAYPTTSYAQILGYYGGGTSSQATSGPNFGITFAANAVAVCLNGPGGSCSNASRNGTAPTSDEGTLGIDSGTSTYLDFASAYTGAIAFRYQVQAGFVATITAYSGLGGTGAALGSGTLALFNTGPPCPTYNATLCNMGPGGLGFVTGAQSIVFAGTPGKFVFDDLTFGAGNDPLAPPAVPEPSTWALLVGGFVLAGSALRSRRLPGRTVQS